jgi:hypothetical protein
VCLEESSKSANTKHPPSSKALWRTSQRNAKIQTSTANFQSIIVLERTRIFAWQEILCVAAARLCELRAHSEGNLAVRLWLQDGWRSELGVRSLRLYTLIYGYFAYLRMACGRGRGTRICEPEKWAVRLCSHICGERGKSQSLVTSAPTIRGERPVGTTGPTFWHIRNLLEEPK